MKYKEIPNYENYVITPQGKVYSKRKDKFYKKSIRFDKDGYPRTVLFKNSKRYDAQIHIIQAITWIGEIPKGYQVNHIDGNISNTHYKNMEILSPKENIKHKLNVLKSCTISFEIAEKIRKDRKKGLIIAYLMIKYNLTYAIVYQVINNLTWKSEYHTTK